jgi:hypothetical protein
MDNGYKRGEKVPKWLVNVEGDEPEMTEGGSQSF